MAASPGETSPADESSVALDDPVYRAAVVDLLGAVSYGEISAFERLAEDAKLAPTLQDKVAIAAIVISAVLVVIAATVTGRSNSRA